MTIKYDGHNLCKAAGERICHITLPCVPRPRPGGGRMPWDPDYAHIRKHSWDEGICAHCHKDIREVRLRLNPQKEFRPIPSTRDPRYTLAMLIAITPADVPEVQFIGEPQC